MTLDLIYRKNSQYDERKETKGSGLPNPTSTSGNFNHQT